MITIGALRLVLAAYLTFSVATAEAQTLVYCKNLQTQQIQIFEGFCPAGWMFVRWA